MSIGPRSLWTASRSSGTASRSSESNAYPQPPISPATCSARSVEREVTATFTPSAASPSAMPRPMPFEPAVTSATLPSSPRSITPPPGGEDGHAERRAQPVLVEQHADEARQPGERGAGEDEQQREPQHRAGEQRTQSPGSRPREPAPRLEELPVQ